MRENDLIINSIRVLVRKHATRLKFNIINARSSHNGCGIGETARITADITAVTPAVIAVSWIRPAWS